ncbi:MAG TPA: efflux RND transporter periplasmic adaptor subunit [Planctomycetota bacterium]|nr:efflux RND transporter periplasmic adaptor subunit [Planctomycetota bacterium]
MSMIPRLKRAIPFTLGLLILAALGAGGWILVRPPGWLKADADDDEKGPEVPPVPAVWVGKITRATLRRYVEGFGTIEAQPAQVDRPAASGRVASPIAGVVSRVLCAPGQKVEPGTALFQLDERAAQAEEDKAQAALDSARSSLVKLKAFPRPEQLSVGEMQVDRARRAVEFSQKKNGRLVKLVADELASEKTLQEAELELVSARNDLAVAEKQLLLLKASPAPEEVAEAQAKVIEAEKALIAVRVQRSLLRIRSPLAGTVIRVRVNPGEAVDLTTVLADVVDLDRLCVDGTIPAVEARGISTGMEAEIRSGDDGLAVPALKGVVEFVSPELDRKTDTGLVRVSLPKKGAGPIGQVVRLRIVAEVHPNRLVVPRESVVTTPEGKTVVVGFLGEKAVQKEVKVGFKEGDLVEVEGEDIEEGNPIVVQGAYGIPEESKVQILGTR